MAATENKRLVFLCSGGGGNLAFVHQAIASNFLLGVSIVAVISDRMCQANRFADKVGMLNYCIDFKEQSQLLTLLNELQPDLIVTTVHKIIGAPVVARYRNHLINLHYSLLPAFAGLIGIRSVQAALDHGCNFTGVTVHLVDESLDGGRPLAQGVIAIQRVEEINMLMQVVFRVGCLALLGVLIERLGEATSRRAARGLSVLGRSCLLNGGEMVPEGLIGDEYFWQKLRQMLNVAE